MSLLDKLNALNTADLSQLQARIDALRATLEQEITARGDNPNRAITPADLQQASAQTGLSVDDLLAALETARKVL